MNKTNNNYYPKQIPYILNQTFKKYIDYKEYKIKSLTSYIMCIWQMTTKKTNNKIIYNNILPDACIDLIIDFKEKTITLAGFSKETTPFKLNQKIDYLGVRLKPGTASLIYKIDADKIMDNRIDINKIDKQNELSEIFKIKETKKRIKILENYLLKKLEDQIDTKFIKMVEEIYKSPKEQTVKNIALRLGYNKRHLLRIFKKYYGVSPKILLNTLRLHFSLILLLENKTDLTEISEMCGFYDQSHFIKTVKKYTNFSPLQLIKNQ